jgi:putative flippase GtrA
VFCFCGGGGFLIRFVLYSLLYSMFLMLLLPVSPAFSVIGCVYSRFSK